MHILKISVPTFPTISPTLTPTLAPTLSPSLSPLFIEEVMINIKVSDSNSASIMAYTLVSFGAFISILALCHSRNCLKCCNKIPGFYDTDDANWISAIIFVVQCFDMYSDAIFSWQLSVYNDNLNHVDYVKDTHQFIMQMLFYSSLLFCVVQ